MVSHHTRLTLLLLLLAPRLPLPRLPLLRIPLLRLPLLRLPLLRLPLLRLPLLLLVLVVQLLPLLQFLLRVPLAPHGLLMTELLACATDDDAGAALSPAAFAA